MSKAETPQRRIAIIGASGGIGSALIDNCLDRFPDAVIHGFSRDGGAHISHKVTIGRLDYGAPSSIEAAAHSIARPLDLVIVATGLLKSELIAPEKSLRDLDADQLALSYQVNTIGPALVMKHFLPLMQRDDRSVFAVLSARVGSISDNRLGGWYGYRSAKAALNQMVKTASIEQARRFKKCAVITLHPGTVDTGLSRPFQANVPDEKLFSPDYAAGKLLDVVDKISAEDTGKIFAWDGSVIPA